MVHRKIKYAFYVAICFATACKHQPQIPTGGYPADVGYIMVGKCATSGCHNNQSAAGAAGLNLTTWEDMFAGARSGAVTIPYRADFSTLCFYTNTDTALGVTLAPTMPEGQAPLSKEEYLTIRDWVTTGAANSKGEIKFADNPNRKKIYVANRMCDVVTVFDAATLLQMRYIDVGTSPAQEFPVCIKVAPDKKNWYVSFFSQGGIVQKYNADNDQWAGNLQLGVGSWTSFAITSDSKYGYFVDNSNPGKIAYVNLHEMKVLGTYTFNGNFQYPIGIVINERLQKLYAGNSFGNFIYCIDIANPLVPIVEEVAIDGSGVIKHEPINAPLQMLTDANNQYCYIICQLSNEVRVVDMHTNTLKHRIALPAAPASIAYAPLHKKLFVSCTDDTVSFPANRGSIVVIDEISNTIIKKINSGYQPYGIAVDEERNIAAVANANLNSGGPAPHHSTNCGGRNGNVTFIDLNTLNLIQGKKSEVAVFPISVGIR